MTTPPRILVVDDEDVIVGAARRLLSADGFDVVAAADAEAGLEALAGGAGAVDVALVDLQLPGLSGLDFVERAAAAHPGLAVIVMTGYASVDTAVASLRRGAFDFLPKPFTFDELRSPVRRALRYLARPEAPAAPPGYARLGLHAWTCPEAGGTARLGLTDTFVATAGSVAHLALPEPNDLLWQGGPLARLTAADGLDHVARAPLGGRVVEVNDRLAADPGRVAADPYRAGWLARIRPADAPAELANLR